MPPHPTFGMFTTPKSLKSTAPRGARVFSYDSDDEGDDLREKRLIQKRQHEGEQGGELDSPSKMFKTQRSLSYGDEDVLGTIAAMADDGQVEVHPEPPKPVSKTTVIVLDEIEEGEGEFLD